jgi:prepilin-type N-terminal cleavage/methylation domain-containing protein
MPGRARPAQSLPPRSALTLIELMVVIGIVAVLLAIVVPVIRSLRESNRIMMCAANLHAIHTAIKAYSIDEGAVPPYDLKPADDPSSAATVPQGNGLYTLLTTGYLGRDMTLHCPSHTNVQTDNPHFFHTYDIRDTQARTDSASPLSLLNQYKYLPYRGAASGDPDYHRQLARGTGTSPYTATVYDPSWRPDDSSVVCWCDKHYMTLLRGGVGQYQVLFWGGNVDLRPKSLMQGTGTDPTEAWRVRPQ